MTSPIARLNTTNGSADFKLHCGHSPSWYNVLERQYFWQCTRAQTAPHEAHNSQSSDIMCRLEYQRSANDYIYYVRDIGHHKIESITSNVSGTAHQLITTWQIAKINRITPMLISRRDWLQPLRVMNIGITNKDQDCLIINWLHPSHRVMETVIKWTVVGSGKRYEHKNSLFYGKYQTHKTRGKNTPTCSAGRSGIPP